MKSVQIRTFFWSVFPHIRTDYAVNLRIQSEYGKIWIRKNSVFGYFSRNMFSAWLSFLLISSFIWLVEQAAEDLLSGVETDESVACFVRALSKLSSLFEVFLF